MAFTISESAAAGQYLVFRLAHTFRHKQDIEMELRHLRYFTAVAAHGSFNQAAANLHITQPGLSRQVRDLEDELGVILLKRSKNMIALTEAGKIFYDEARDVLASADRAVQRVRRQTRAVTLRVGYAPSLVAGVLPRTLERFQMENPVVRVDLQDLSASEMWKLGKDGLLDLILSPVDEESQLKDFIWQEVRRLNGMLVLPRSHPLAKLKRVPPARLKGQPLIALKPDTYPEYAPTIRRVLKLHGITPYFAQWVDGISSLFAAAEASGNASVLTEGVISFLPSTLVARPFCPNLDPARLMGGISAVVPNPHAARFLQLFREEAQLVPKSRQ